MIIWITGASSGLGRATALEYLDRGACVIACGRSADKLQNLAAHAVGLKGKLYTFSADVRDKQQLADRFATAVRVAGPPDTAILNAGSFVRTPAADFSVGVHRELMDINYFGVLNCIELALESMRIRQRGQIAIVASVAGYRGLPGASAYGASKAALINLAESLHEELRLEGIDVRLVNPGFVKTPLTDLNDFRMPMLMPAEDAARALVSGLKGPRFEIIFPRTFVWMMKLLRTLPAVCLFAIARRMIRASNWHDARDSSLRSFSEDDHRHL